MFHWKPEKKPKWVWSWGQIRFNVVKKSKKPSIISFSCILHREYILKQEVVVVQTPGWQFKANIARNVTFQ